MARVENKLLGMPQELIDMIVGEIQPPRTSTKVKLILLCRGMREKFERAIYNNPDMQKNAVQYACRTGKVDPLHALVRHGASIDSVFIKHKDGSVHPSSSLICAVRKKHSKVFRYLLQNSGWPRDGKVLRHLLDIIFRPRCISRRPKFADYCIQGRPRTGLEPVGEALDDFKPLVRLIQANAAESLIVALIDRGADPNALSNDLWWHERLSPLSAAALSYSIPLFRLLIDHGASVTGRDLLKPTRRALHLPIFAASYAMAIAPDRKSLDAAWSILRCCLDNGADINQLTRVLGLYNPSNPGTQHGEIFIVTPIFLFLNSLRSWRVSKSKPSSSLRVRNFLSFGPNVRPEEFLAPESFQKQMPDGDRIAESQMLKSSVLGFLFQKWDVIDMVNRTDFYYTVKLLVNRGAARNQYLYLLLELHKSTLPPPRAGPTTWGSDSARAKYVRRAKTRLEAFTDLVVNDIHSTNTTIIFWKLIISMCRERIIPESWQIQPLKCLVDKRLVDVNCISLSEGQLLSESGVPASEIPPVQSETALHFLCRLLRACEQEAAERLRRQAMSPESDGTPNVETIKTVLITFLVSNGADPSLKFNNLEAFEVLEKGTEDLSATSQTFLRDVANEIRSLRKSYLTRRDESKKKLTPKKP